MHVYTCSNRTVPVSKLEVLFEAETLAERDKFDEGTDVSTQAPALRRLGGKILKKRHSEKVRYKLVSMAILPLFSCMCRKATFYMYACDKFIQIHQDGPLDKFM